MYTFKILYSHIELVDHLIKFSYFIILKYNKMILCYKTFGDNINFFVK